MENSQESLFDSLADDYLNSFADEESLRYRQRFINPHLLKNVDLNGKVACDVGCGGGFNTLEILKESPGGEFVGFDISSKLCDNYRETTGFPAYQVDFTGDIPKELESKFDYVFVIAAFHHMTADLGRAIDNAHKILKPGGTLITFEPQNRFLLEPVRKLWYKVDSRFDNDNERALDLDEMTDLAGDKLSLSYHRYLAGPSYLLIVNSMILGIPKFLKRIITPLAMGFESLYQKLRWRALHNCFVLHLRKSE